MKTTIAILAATAALNSPGHAREAGSRDARGQLNFQGRYIVSVQDADMVGSAYVNGQLGPREGADTLAVIPLEGDPRDWQAAEVFASNSVAGPPNAVSISPDGRFAIVIETFTPRPDNNDPHVFSDLQVGAKAQVFDLQDPTRPTAVQTIDVPARPDAVSFNTRGDIVAITYNPTNGAGGETPLTLHRFQDGKLEAGVAPSVLGWPMGDRMIDAAWHPEENILAMIDSSGGATLTFARVTDDLAVEPFGNVVDIERAPYRVLFTPDGSHVVVNATYWGPDIAGTWVEAPVGSVLTVRMNAEVRNDGSVRHALIDRVETGVSPEGLAVSPDGRWVATVNLERSYLPYDDPRIT